MEKLFDAIIVVSADPSVALSRYTHTTGLSQENFEARMKHQEQPLEKQKKQILSSSTTEILQL
jgi:dephospho-CoA kinase